MKRVTSLFVLLTMAVMLFSCSAASKSVKRGEKAALRGDYYMAAQEYLDVLGTKPKHGKALEKLSETAKPAYEQKLEMAGGYRDQGNLESALQEYTELQQFVASLRQHNALKFVPIDIGKAIKEVSLGAAEGYYEEAEVFYKQRNYETAIPKYKTALDFADPYKDTRGKLAESCYQIALKNEKQNAYRSAAENYEMANDWFTGHKNSVQKAAEIYYHLGTYFLSAQHCRKAHKDFVKAQQMMPDFKDLNSKIIEAKACASTRIAFMRFDNPTRKNVAGMVLGDFIFDTIKSFVQARSSEFIKVMEREELRAIVSEKYMDEELVMNSPQRLAKLEGVEFMVFGKLNQVREQSPGLSGTRQQGTYSYAYEEDYINKKGKKRTRTKWAEASMSYTLYRNKISLTLAGAIKVIDVKNGAIVIQHQISEHRSDEVVYADGFRAPHDLTGRNIDMPNEIRELAGARQELKDVSVLANAMIKVIADGMTREMLAEIDRTPNVADPGSLPLTLTAK